MVGFIRRLQLIATLGHFRNAFGFACVVFGFIERHLTSTLKLAIIGLGNSGRKRFHSTKGSPFSGFAIDDSRLTFEKLETRCVLTTTLGLGDVAFTGFQSSAPDKVSIVLLRDVTAGTVLTVTDNAWTSPSGPLASSEGSSTLTFGANFAAGSQFNFDASRSAGLRWANGSVATNLSDVTTTNFALNGSGDNLFIFNGSTAPATATAPEWIAGFATNPFLVTGSTTSSSLTFLPSVMTAGNSALTLGIANATPNENGAYSSGSFTGTSSAVRSQVHAVANWTTFTAAGGQAIPPSAVFTINGGTNSAPTITSNLGITVRTSSIGNIISGSMLSANDAEQTADQLTYRVTTLPSVGTLRFNSVAVVANVTTFTQDDINSGRLTYDGPAVAGNNSFTFSVSDGALSANGTFAIRVIANLFLNELKVNPPGNIQSGNKYQYIELRGTPNLSLTNVFVAMLDGNGSSIGRANYVLPLNGRSLGSNGLLMIKSPTAGHDPAPSTAVVTDPLFDTTVGGILSKQTVSFYLGTTAIGLSQGADYDANNDGTLELLPNDFVILDNVGWSDGDAGDLVYGGVALTQSAGTPDAATRLNSNTSTSVAAWFNGDLFDLYNDPAELQYDSTRGSVNLPTNPTIASLTPGAINFSAKPVIITNTGLSVLLGTINNVISGINLASNDAEFPSSQLSYRVTSLPSSGTLKLNGSNVIANTTVFNQADIDLGRLTLDAASAAGSASFAFSVSNGFAIATNTFLLGYRAVSRTNLRVVSYNIANADVAPRTGLNTVLQAIGTEVVNGISRQIDVLALQEVASQATTSQLVAGLLNSTYGTVAYATGTLNGATTGSGTQGVVYNSASVTLLEETLVGTASSTGAPRQTLRYKFRPVGTTGSLDFYLFNSHLKSADDSASEARRLSEVQAIRANADALGSGVHAIYTGDFNFYRSTDAGYQHFVSAGNGRASDPISTPGNWHNNSSFVGIYTQAPSTSPPAGFTSGGLDDRFDFQLITDSLKDGVGLDYSSGSYHTFGNNGSVGLNSSINSPSSTALPLLSNRTTVLDLLTTVTDHLPVVADYYYGSGATNAAPTDVSLSNSSTVETAVSGAVIGVFSSVDPNVGDVHTYSLVSGTGSTDNARFLISGNQLQTSVNANLDGARNYSIRVRSTDQNGLTFDKVLSVAVTNVAPTVSTDVLSVIGNEGSVLSNSGKYRDVPGDVITLTASTGTVTKNADGTWTWALPAANEALATSVTILAQDEDGGSSSTSFTYTINNVAPTVAVTTPTVSGTVLSVFSNSGTWSDVPADVVTLSASVGTVTKNANGTWTWSYIPPAVVSSQVVTITASDGVGSSNVSFTIAATAASPSLVIASGNRIYDRTAYSASATLSGSVAPTPSISYQYFSDAVGNSAIVAPVNVGTYYVRAVSAANTNNNGAQSALTAFTIGRANLVASATANNKPFDNTTLATIATRSLSGVLGTDVVTVSGGTANFADVGVGNNKTVNVTGLVISGADAGNYTANSAATALANITATVFNRQLFYNDSGFETTGGVNAALSTNKVLLQSTTTSQTTTFANVSNYSRGLNGAVLDIAGLMVSTLSANDFTLRIAPAGASGVQNPSIWASAPLPSAIVVTAGTASVPGRVQLEWASNQVQNTWLQIIVKANANTGLSIPQTFYIGHALGEVNGAAPYRLTGADLSLIQSGISNAIVAVNDIRDVNKDRRITGADLSFVQARISNSVLLNNITIPASGSNEEGSNGGSGSGGGMNSAPLPSSVAGNHLVSLPVLEASEREISSTAEFDNTFELIALIHANRPDSFSYAISDAPKRIDKGSRSPTLRIADLVDSFFAQVTDEKLED